MPYHEGSVDACWANGVAAEQQQTVGFHGLREETHVNEQHTRGATREARNGQPTGCHASRSPLRWSMSCSIVQKTCPRNRPPCSQRAKLQRIPHDLCEHRDGDVHGQHRSLGHRVREAVLQPNLSPDRATKHNTRHDVMTTTAASLTTRTADDTGIGGINTGRDLIHVLVMRWTRC
jgi:hypothetical protein